MDFIQPKAFVVSAPSGSGKTTIIQAAIRDNPDFVLSVSHTSRKPRKGERDGVDYYFVDEDTFHGMIAQNAFLEWAEVHGNYYGTSIAEIRSLANQGKNVILDIDVQGAQQIRSNQQLVPVFIFIEPPSMDELKRRLKNRESETEETLEKRLNNARQELSFKDRYDYIIVNDTLERAVHEFVQIVKASGKQTTAAMR